MIKVGLETQENLLFGVNFVLHKAPVQKIFRKTGVWSNTETV